MPAGSPIPGAPIELLSVVPFASIPYALDAKFCKGAKAASIGIDWSSYPFSAYPDVSTNAGIGVFVEMQPSQNNNFSPDTVLRYAHINTLLCGADIYLYFPDTGYYVFCTVGRSGWFPIYTNSFQCIVIGCNFNSVSNVYQATFNNFGTTQIVFTDGFINESEAEYSLPHWTELGIATTALPNFSRGVVSYFGWSQPNFYSRGIGDLTFCGDIAITLGGTSRNKIIDFPQAELSGLYRYCYINSITLGLSGIDIANNAHLALTFSTIGGFNVNTIFDLFTGSGFFVGASGAVQGNQVLCDKSALNVRWTLPKIGDAGNFLLANGLALYYTWSAGPGVITSGRAYWDISYSLSNL